MGPVPVRGAVPSEAGSVVLPGGKGAGVGVGRWVSGRLRVGRGWVLVMTLCMGSRFVGPVDTGE
ncbi:hypothetical protein SUDANB1_04924 [Streptomyces sp. enrichment culture]